MTLDDVKLYLPKYLSAPAQRDLLSSLAQFPDNFDGRLYSDSATKEPIVFQGDCIRELPIIDLPAPTIRTAKCVVLSNTCDIEISNKRYFSSYVSYVPVFSLEKFKATLLHEHRGKEERIHDFISSLRKQPITQILFL